MALEVASDTCDSLRTKRLYDRVLLKIKTEQELQISRVRYLAASHEALYAEK
jgi:hypothetical protein